MAVDNALVQKFSQDALDVYKELVNCNRIAKALGSVITSRQSGFESDSMAAADHYLNMRLMTSFNFMLYTPCYAAIQGYDLLKHTLGFLSSELQDLLKESKAPLSKPSPEIRAWAVRGLDDGLGDWPGLLRTSDLKVPSSPSA